MQDDVELYSLLIKLLGFSGHTHYKAKIVNQRLGGGRGSVRVGCGMM